MKSTFLLTFFMLQCFVSCQQATTAVADPTEGPEPAINFTEEKPILAGAEQIDQYLDLLKGKEIALTVNQTSMVGPTHLVDTLANLGINIKSIFAPEHGFRGQADAGETVKDGKDEKTGIPVVSLYGKNKKPTAKMLEGIDLVVFDIQDVGARFYTYISSMCYIMEACAEQNIPFLVLDRPNPNGHYVDGPILQPEHRSFIGLHPVPIVHGMTMAEYAQMVNEEGWLKDEVKCDLSFIKCANYSHSKHYILPIKPSPNLPNQRSIYMYPSLCLFEGTTFSVGRGTDKQFQVLGHPDNLNGDYRFTPVPKPGAKYPKHEGKECVGFDFTDFEIEYLQKVDAVDLDLIVGLYNAFPDKEKFFREDGFFNLLTGNSEIMENIIAGKPAALIEESWQSDVDVFKVMRKQYLLYPDFE
ncbi:MAG: DUF1343 domain-containing protein [Bacteroidota bacterium]